MPNGFLKASGNTVEAEAFCSPYMIFLQAVGDQVGYDLYLLDILMPCLSGIDLAQKVRERGENSEILFLTVTREYAVEAFAVKASGYLVKPVRRKTLSMRC